jgi:hypothetical protein
MGCAAANAEHSISVENVWNVGLGQISARDRSTILYICHIATLDETVCRCRVRYVKQQLCIIRVTLEGVFCGLCAFGPGLEHILAAAFHVLIQAADLGGKSQVEAAQHVR